MSKFSVYFLFLISIVGCGGNQSEVHTIPGYPNEINSIGLWTLEMNDDYLFVNGSKRTLGGDYINHKVFVYKRSGDNWNLLQTLEEGIVGFTFGKDISIHDSTLVIGSTYWADDTLYKSHAHIYELQSDTFVRSVTFVNPGQNRHYADAVAVRDGRVIVSDRYNVYVYQKLKNNDWILIQSEPTHPTKFTGSFDEMEMNSDVLALGSPFIDNGTGRLYTYTNDQQGINLRGIANSRLYPSQSSYGTRVSVSDEMIFVNSNSEAEIEVYDGTFPFDSIFPNLVPANTVEMRRLDSHGEYVLSQNSDNTYSELPGERRAIDLYQLTNNQWIRRKSFYQQTRHSSDNIALSSRWVAFTQTENGLIHLYKYR